jgi:hypothetical protein
MKTVIDKLKHFVKKDAPSHIPGHYRPELNCRYYYVYADKVCFKFWNNDSVDSYYLRSCVCCATEDEAKTLMLRMKTRYEILEMIRTLNDGWLPNWRNRYQTKYHFYHDHEPRCGLCIDDSLDYQDSPDEYYFKRKEIGDQIRTKFGDETISFAFWGIQKK